MYKKIKEEIPENVKLVVVSKTRTKIEIFDIYNQGQGMFGENRVDEIVKKYKELPKDIEWHMIGHLQGRKVKEIAPFVALIHSVDSIKLLNTINKEAINNNRVIECLLQVKIAQEDTKYGLFEAEIEALLQSSEYLLMKNIRIVGLMGIATYSKNKDLVRREFKELKKIFNNLKSRYFSNENSFKEVSMGMSGDYRIAIEEGSTMLRIGSLIFK